jgi:hypothetical protein
MSSPAPLEPPAPSLSALEQEERSISKRRARLLDRIDFLRNGGADSDAAQEQLRLLVAEEAEVSARRRELHHQIDELRSLRGS